MNLSRILHYSPKIHYFPDIQVPFWKSKSRIGRDLQSGRRLYDIDQFPDDGALWADDEKVVGMIFDFLLILLWFEGGDCSKADWRGRHTNSTLANTCQLVTEMVGVVKQKRNQIYDYDLDQYEK